LITPQ
jgi:hypothetical protein